LIGLIVEKIADGIDFFSQLPHEKRKLMIDQLSDDVLVAIFKEMNKFQQAELLYMLNQEN